LVGNLAFYWADWRAEVTVVSWAVHLVVEKAATMVAAKVF
jgi:hypothetical protein